MIHCGGGDKRPPCAHGLFDRKKQPAVLELLKRIKSQLIDIPDEGPLKSWLSEMSTALNNIVLAMNKDPDHEQG